MWTQRLNGCLPVQTQIDAMQSSSMRTLHMSTWFWKKFSYLPPHCCCVVCQAIVALMWHRHRIRVGFVVARIDVAGVTHTHTSIPSKQALMMIRTD